MGVSMGIFELLLLAGIPLALLFIGAIFFVFIRGSGKK